MISIDKKEPLNNEQFRKLAIADGIPDIIEFWNWFKKPFKGCIIHFKKR